MLLAGVAAIGAGSRAGAMAIARRWGAFVMLALAASLATPNGLSGLWLPIHLMRMAVALSIIDEWKSSDFQHAGPFEAWLLMLFLALAKGLRLPWRARRSCCCCCIWAWRIGAR